MTIAPSPPIADRFRFGSRAQTVRAGDAHGYAWRHASPTASFVLLHGLQSHAAWFAEAAELLLERGFSVYALDRRGSGSSPAARGHVERYTEWFDEASAMVRLARAEHPDAGVHLVGHCFGANIGLGAMLHQRCAVRSLIMLTPGLEVLPGYSLREKLRIALTSVVAPRTRFRVPQDDALFSCDPEVVAWISADTGGARRVTARCLVQVNRMQRELRQRLHQLEAPVLVLEASRDRISDNTGNRRLLSAALGQRCTYTTFDSEHFLLAEPCRDQVIDRLVGWATSREAT